MVYGRVGDAQMRLNLAQWPEAQGFLLGRYDSSTVQYALSHLPRDGTMIDGGAHVGLISFQVAARRPDVRIHSFEPHPVVAERFVENMEYCPGAQITFNAIGLSDAEGFVPFNFETHSSDRGASGSIPVLRLDDYLDAHEIEQVDVLKLDLEGHELRALEGARAALEGHRIKAITTETIEDHAPLGPVHELLTDAGYGMVEMPDPRPYQIRRVRPLRRRENTAYEADRGRGIPSR